MARLLYSDGFLDDMLAVRRDGKRDEILDRIDLLSDFPDLGSANVPESIRVRYGESVRKLVVTPFDVVYDYDPSSQTVSILGLVHQRAAY